ncbi:MAG TPA: ABC transporter substrate-binding protein [Aggregatilineales bacterium]|nr:ABC transporter substrate-binding protein [Aggregatilineales bacterium]
MSRQLKWLFVALVAALALRPALAQTAPAADTPVTLFMGYLPNIQFAPVYVAVERGYFKADGIDIKLEHGFDETDGLNRIATNKLQFGLISGEQVILARANNAPVTYVFRWYQRFPVGVAVPADSGITDPKQLAGHTVGLPGKYGASYVGFEALLNAVGLKESDLKELKAVGFGIDAFCNKQVEASVVYVANEPAQIASKCFKVNVFKISDFANLMSNGLVTNETALKNSPDLVRSMNDALARGLADTLADPKAAYTISQKYVDNLAADDPVQMGVLTNSMDLWKTVKFGYSDPEAWKLTLATLKAMGLITSDVDLTRVYSNDYLPNVPVPAATAAVTPGQ